MVHNIIRVAGRRAVLDLAGDAVGVVVGVGVVGLEDGSRAAVTVLQDGDALDGVVDVAGRADLVAGAAVDVAIARDGRDPVRGRILEIDAQRGRAGARELERRQAIDVVIGRGAQAPLGILHLRAVADLVVGEREPLAKRLMRRRDAVEGVVGHRAPSDIRVVKDPPPSLAMPDTGSLASVLMALT